MCLLPRSMVVSNYPCGKDITRAKQLNFTEKNVQYPGASMTSFCSGLIDLPVFSLARV